MAHATLDPPDQFTHIKSKKIDRRRDKEYARQVTFMLEVPLRKDEYSAPNPWPEQELRKLIKARWPSRATRTHCNYWRGYRDEGPQIVLSVMFQFPADKPSKILSEEDCIASIGGAEEVLPFFLEACAHAQAEFDETRAREQIAHEAESLARHLAAHIRKESDLEVRYEQRRAALNAERAAEMDVRAKTRIDALIKEARAQWDEDEEWFQLVAEHAKTMLDAHLKAQRSLPMFRGVKKQLQPEAVLLPDGFLPREGWPPSEEEED
jgi:hypothetical protein